MGRCSWTAIGDSQQAQCDQGLEAVAYEGCVRDNTYPGAEFEYNFPDMEVTLFLGAAPTMTWKIRIIQVREYAWMRMI